jgi:hypothetical protein
MTAAALFAVVGFLLGVAAAYTWQPRADATARAWEKLCRDERDRHYFTRVALREALAAQEMAAAQVAVLTATVEGAAFTPQPPAPVLIGEDVRSRFCWN